jgi:hypothetical protein
MLAGDIHTASDPELEADRFALLRANACEKWETARPSGRRFTASAATAATAGSAAARSS